MRTDVRIPAAGAALAGWLYVPDGGTQRYPLVVMSHGFSAVKSMGLQDYAVVFEQAGIACLLYDHRSLGQSEGEPCQEVDPWQQVHDMRDVISYARSRPEVDPERIGIWGTSYSGSHVLVVAAIDRRVKCVSHRCRSSAALAPFRAGCPPPNSPPFGPTSSTIATRARGESRLATSPSFAKARRERSGCAWSTKSGRIATK